MKVKEKLRNFYSKLKKQHNLKRLREKYRESKKITVCLFVSRPGMWQFDYLYKKLVDDIHFDTKVIVMPDPVQRDMMFDFMQAVLAELKAKEIDAIAGWDYKENKPLELRKSINPDILIYTDFWKDHFFKEFYISSFLDKVNLLIPYGYNIVDDKWSHIWELNNLVDFYVLPTQIHKDSASKIMKNKGKNIFVAGSPKLDVLFDSSYTQHKAWKPQDTKKKKVIFAPHHQWEAAPDQYKFDSFLIIYDFMFEVAKKYKDKIQIAFRPHPMLKSKLIEKWGDKLANEYYEKWENLENGQYSTNSFIDLFYQSDCLITDCCGFLAEYTAFNKPLFHCLTPTCRPYYNQFGDELCKLFYKPAGFKDGDLELGIEQFIQNVVINGNDIYKDERTLFVERFFGKNNNKTASQNIYDKIVETITIGRIPQ